MASPSETRMTYREPAVDERDPTIGHALERVVEAGQGLIVRRIDLLVEELSGLGNNLVIAAASVVLGAVAALVGWLVTLAGVIDALDNYFARHWVEIALGVLHLLAGAALLWRRKLAKAAS